MWVTEVTQTYTFPAHFHSAVNGNSYFWGKGSLPAGERTDSIQQELNIVKESIKPMELIKTQHLHENYVAASRPLVSVFKVVMVMRSFKFVLFCSKFQAAGAYDAAQAHTTC